MSFPLLLVGLGNPGIQYELTLHNLGFRVIDAFSKKHSIKKYQKKLSGLLGEAIINEKKIYLLKPQTYMNKSGLSVEAALTFFKLTPEESLVIISDDLDLPPGKIRIRKKGGAGGHNGLKSIIEQLGTQNFPRLRIGIGRSQKMAADDYVLSTIRETSIYDGAIQNSVLALDLWISDGISKAMNKYNQEQEDA